MVEDPSLLPSVQATPAGLSGAEPHLHRQELPGYVVVEDEQDALETEPVRDRSRTRRPLRPRRQQRLDQCPQLVIHDPRSSTHTLTNGRILTPVTTNQDVSARSCYELVAQHFGKGGRCSRLGGHNYSGGTVLPDVGPIGPYAGLDTDEGRTAVAARP